MYMSIPMALDLSVSISQVTHTYIYHRVLEYPTTNYNKNEQANIQFLKTNQKTPTESSHTNTIFFHIAIDTAWEISPSKKKHIYIFWNVCIICGF